MIVYIAIGFFQYGNGAELLKIFANKDKAIEFQKEFNNSDWSKTDIHKKFSTEICMMSEYDLEEII